MTAPTTTPSKGRRAIAQGHESPIHGPELFYDPKTSMLFGDAKVSLGKLVTEMKNV